MHRCHEGAMSSDSLAGIPMDMASVLDGVDRSALSDAGDSIHGSASAHSDTNASDVDPFDLVYTGVVRVCKCCDARSDTKNPFYAMTRHPMFQRIRDFAVRRHMPWSRYHPRDLDPDPVTPCPPAAAVFQNFSEVGWARSISLLPFFRSGCSRADFTAAIFERVCARVVPFPAVIGGGITTVFCSTSL